MLGVQYALVGLAFLEVLKSVLTLAYLTSSSLSWSAPRLIYSYMICSYRTLSTSAIAQP